MFAFPAGTTVYIIEGDDAVRDSTGVLLELEGLKVESFGAIADFLTLYRKPECGCLIIDQHLPRTTGLEFLESAEGQRLGIPVILVTAAGDEALRQRAMRDGVAAYLDKPLQQYTLLRTLAMVLMREPQPAGYIAAIH